MQHLTTSLATEAACRHPLPAHGQLSRRHLLAAVAGGGLLTACGGGNDGVSAAAHALVQAAQAAVQPRKPVPGAEADTPLAGVACGWLTPVATELAAAGVRQVGGNAPIALGDHFIIGSTTKAMTAATTARLAEQGRLRLDSTLAELLPTLVPTMHPTWQRATVTQLLDHTSGLPPYVDGDETTAFADHLATAAVPAVDTEAQRRGVFVRWLLAQPPQAGRVPGGQFLYSNAGYMVAGHVLEAVTGQAFQTAFASLLTQALGVQGHWQWPQRVSPQAPAGHETEAGRLVVVPQPAADDQLWLDTVAPAGLFATTARGFAAWVRWHLWALRGQATPLPASYLARLQALPVGGYGMGWVKADVNGQPWLVHDGHWMGFMSIVAVAANGSKGVFALTNSGSGSTAALFELTSAMRGID